MRDKAGDIDVCDLGRRGYCWDCPIYSTMWCCTKTHNMFRVIGTYPGEYELRQVFSTRSAIAERSIVSEGDAGLSSLP